jgi:hypothetical protein
MQNTGSEAMVVKYTTISQSVILKRHIENMPNS